MDANDGSEETCSRPFSRLTYANVVATGALFLAFGGGAYALTGIPDRGGIFHGCVSNATGLLRVVKSARSCQKAKTVRRHGKRVRLPGELAVSWNQQGPRGLQGIQGIQGLQGVQGVQGQKGDTGIQGIQGVQGQKGDTGLPGQNATKLFGYIDDGQTGNPATDTAVLGYGSGVTAVSDTSGNGAYTVTFNRSLQNCVVNAVAGFGDPAGSATSNFNLVPFITMDAGADHSKVQVAFVTGGTASAVDDAFMITAFC